MLDQFFGSHRSASWALEYWPVLGVSFIGALIATWLCKKIATKFGIVDKPDNLVKTHSQPIAYLGGIGIFIGLTIGIMTGVYLISGHPHVIQSLKWLFGILAGGAIACAIGVIDDILDIKPWQKLLGQCVAAITLVVVGIYPSLQFITIYTPFEMTPNLEFALGIPIVLIFVLGATNSLNLLDGLDGLCGGVTAIITIAFLLLAIQLGTWSNPDTGYFKPDSVRVIVCLSLVGGVFGFLPFNRHPAKIFMGDAGSMLLGFIVAALMILYTRMTVPRWWLAGIVIFGLPILDTATALVRRLINKKPLLISDRGHIYDQMIDRGIPLEKTVALNYTLSGLFAVIGIVMGLIRTRYAILVFIIVFAISGVIIWKLGFLKMDGLRGAIRKDRPSADKESSW